MNADLLKAAIRNKVFNIDPNALAAPVQTVRLGYQALVKRTDTDTVIWADSVARDTYIDAATDAAIALSIIAQGCNRPSRRGWGACQRTLRWFHGGLELLARKCPGASSPVIRLNNACRHFVATSQHFEWRSRDSDAGSHLIAVLSFPEYCRIIGDISTRLAAAPPAYKSCGCMPFFDRARPIHARCSGRRANEKTRPRWVPLHGLI